MWFVYLCGVIGFIVIALFVVFLLLPTGSGIDTIPPSKREDEPFCPHIWQLVDLTSQNENRNWQDEPKWNKIYVYQCIACNKEKRVHEDMKEEFETLFVIESE